MKKTKIFVIGASLLFAGVGMAATKLQTQGLFGYYYELTPGVPSSCESIELDDDPECFINSLDPCEVDVPFIGTRQLFLDENGLFDCINPLTRID